jgi:hypothetical protein
VLCQSIQALAFGGIGLFLPAGSGPMRGRPIQHDLGDAYVRDYAPTTKKEVIIEGIK